MSKHNPASRKEKPYIPNTYESKIIDYLRSQPDCGEGWRKLTSEDVCKALSFSYFALNKYRKILVKQGKLEYYSTSHEGVKCTAYRLKEKGE